jgi:hypothetical protein
VVCGLHSAVIHGYTPAVAFGKIEAYWIVNLFTTTFNTFCIKSTS